MSRLLFAYNSSLGGFLLQLAPFERSKSKKLPLGEGLAEVYLSPEQRVLAIESAWEQGGLFIHGLQAPLEGIFHAEAPTHDIKGEGFALQQDAEVFSLWFSPPPSIGGPSFLCQREGTTRTSLWFSEQWRPLGPTDKRPKVDKKSEIIRGDKVRCIGGLQLKFAVAALTYPIESIEFVSHIK